MTALEWLFDDWHRTVLVADDAGHLAEVCVLFRGHVAAAQVVVVVEAQRAVVPERPGRALGCGRRLLQHLPQPMLPCKLLPGLTEDYRIQDP